MRNLFLLVFMSVVSFADDANLTDYEELNITVEQWNNQLATVANNVGFTMVFLVCFLAVLVMRK